MNRREHELEFLRLIEAAADQRQIATHSGIRVDSIREYLKKRGWATVWMEHHGQRNSRTFAGQMVGILGSDAWI